ncbi:hypothetical protein L202_07452 [Cryptococcus amylolentus CBS 6039]|uniref:Ubiquitin thioesterase OTU n=1 Tax=Cryptococcus amylolentus CBS 6039 TaxID=1295533 RepID=A0A1E3HEU0_9TREE|nr:hypothetical protein L202_07452 [Cryptococcus amylolentus CBS 6039]ODN73951.1 hypothetical protein L202_07452 [Cryptococcus amylolentus CBS 6039]
MKARLRAPQGVSTLELDAESTVHDLQALIFAATQIPPAEQDIKYSYPPKPLPVDTGLLSSIPITNGEQFIVSAVPTATQTAPMKSEPAPPTIPAPSTSAKAPAPKVEGADSVALPGRDAGYLQLRVVPDDNSCLFSAIAVVFEGGIDAAQSLRTVVAEAIRADPETYSQVILGMPRDEYIRRILKPETWGGAIELSIFAKQQVASTASSVILTPSLATKPKLLHLMSLPVDATGLARTNTTLDYDAITLSPLPVSPPDFHTSVFPSVDQTILLIADNLVAQLRARHYYTDTSNFDLRCRVCKQGLKGEKGATEHAKKTGHVEFGEY